MIVIDANVLLFAYNEDAPLHRPVADWLTAMFRSGESIGLPWVAIWAFIRISTNSRIWSHPKTSREAFGLAEEWLAQPGVIALSPGPQHTVILERLVSQHGAIGPLVTDAVFAALAIEYGASLASTDQDFRRFPEVRWINPLRN